MPELNNQLFYQMAALSVDGYFIYDVVEKKFLYLNKSMSNILEIDETELYENPGLLLNNIHPDDQCHARSCFNECLNDREEKKYEIRLLFPNREKYTRVIVYPIETNGNGQLIGTVEDTTVMRHNKIHIEQINSRKNITLEVLAHDLKEPLGMMKLAATSIEQGIDQLGNQEMIDSLSFIKEMCERNLLLIRSMINKEFLKSAAIEIGKERSDVVWELRDIVRFFKRSKLGRTRKFIFTTSSDPIYLPLDSMKFVQVINNLISNALKFTADNGIIQIHAQEENDHVTISVADNGIGIPEELQVNLFDRLPETLRSGLQGEESGGFGMSIVKSIVDLHQGKVWFESEVGVGTTFYIELPR